MTSTQCDVPIIDLSCFTQGVSDFEEQEKVISELSNCMQNIGFFYIKNHGVENSLVEQMFSYGRIFFSKSEQTKQKIKMENNGLAWRGWFPLGGELTSGRADKKEGLYLGQEHSLENANFQKRQPTFGQNPWLEGEEDLKGFKETYQEYLVQLTRLAHLLLSLIARGLGLKEDYFKERFTDDPTILFRIFSYPKHEWNEEQDEWGVREHTDYGFLTILKQDQSGGLQVKRMDGTWVEAPPVQDTFVINIGDMLELWTHGYYRATPHRVRNKAGSDRISMPFFFDPNWDQTLERIDKQLLPQSKSLNQSNANSAEIRWDGIQIQNLSSEKTYGQHLFTKLEKVFPELAKIK